MKGWRKATDPPDEGQPCIIATDNDGAVFVHPISAAWDGKEWVDVNGEEVYGVAYWQYMPAFIDCDIAIEKIRCCAENETCEIVDCCYYPLQAELQKVLRYIKLLEG